MHSIVSIIIWFRRQGSILLLTVELHVSSAVRIVEEAYLGYLQLLRGSHCTSELVGPLSNPRDLKIFHILISCVLVWKIRPLDSRCAALVRILRCVVFLRWLKCLQSVHLLMSVHL